MSDETIMEARPVINGEPRHDETGSNEDVVRTQRRAKHDESTQSTAGDDVSGEEKKDDVPDSSHFQQQNESDSNPSSSNNSAESIKKAPSLLPIVSLSQGLRSKANPLCVKNWIALSLTLDGRDKITKTIQYLSRFLAWWFIQRKLSTIHAKRFQSLYKGVAQSRKAFRIGRSFVEVEKLRSMGLLSLMMWHLRRSFEPSYDADSEPRQKIQLVRQASSNVGWGPSTVPSRSDRIASRSSSFYRSLSNIGSRMYRPLLSQLSQLGPASQPTKVPMWKVVGMSMKLLGLLGFWAADNANFLTSTGVLDDYSLEEKKRLSKRKHMQGTAARWAARSYFAGAVAGLLVNLRSYWTFRQTVIKNSQEQFDKIQSQGEGDDTDDEEDNSALLEKAKQDVREAQEKQFHLFVALLKSCCDVLVFSNNPGVDLHKKYRGKKMNEGFHCLCGLLSASTVLYNNFPNAE